MTSPIRLPAALLAGFLLAACGRSEAPPAPAQHDAKAGDHAAAEEIAWFPGTVDEAFAAAKDQGKPIFLYWGAAWCPPCHEIKATVFRSREFIERSKLFVPVYLDGDSENAQALGEKFGVVGYPTMIVFSPAGQEITRIPGGIDIQAYANVLDLTLARAQPVSALLAQVLDGGLALDESQCRLLAYYSWGQDRSLLADRDSAAAFRALAGACPAAAATERSMLQMAALEAAVKAAGDKENPVAMTAEQKAEALQQVEEVLADKALMRASLYTVIGAGTDITKAITEPGSAERADLQARFVDVLKRVQDDPTLFTTERLYGTLGLVEFARIDDADAPLPAELVEDVRARVEKADAGTSDTYERQTVINIGSHLLEEAGLKDEAKQLLLAELDKSKQPYYFMVGLADLEEEAGNKEAAIDWLKRAYDSSTGPATRFQWGTYYVNGLLEMAPDDVAGIRTATVSVVRELEKGRAFYQRPKAQLERLETKLEAWGTTPERRAGLGEIRKDVLAICGTIPAEEPARATCEGFLG
jgi:thiol-disulfide isomerase/thioredoxin